MSSLKMTFSLTSLILLFAFVAMPGMAHEVGNLPAATPSSHTTHPVTVAVVDDAATTAINEAVPIHGRHPVPKITLKAQSGVVQGDQIKLTAASNTFTVVVDFGTAVNAAATDGTGATVDAAALLTSGQLTVRVISDSGNGETTANAFGTSNSANEVDLGTVIRVADSKGAKFELPLTVGADSIPDGMDGTTADATLNKLAFNIQVNVNAAYGLQKDIGVTTVNGGSSLARLKTFMLVKEFTTTDPKPVMFAVSGTPSLAAPFPVTFTSTTMDDNGDLVGTELMESDIQVSSGDGFVVAGTINDTSPSDAPMTVWQAIVQPVAGATKISVTIKTNKARAPAADKDNGILRIAGITLSSLTAAEGANDEALFVVTLTFSQSVTSLMADDLMVTPMDNPATTAKEAEAMVGTPAAVLGSDNKMWQVEITPVKGMATTVALAEDSDYGMGSVAKLTVKTKAGQAADTAASTPGSISATHDPTKGEVTLSGSIAKNGFVVIGSADLPDIAEFFRVGGTIELMDPTAGTAKKWDVVISEILWGYDHAAPIAMQADRQFIELYNTTGSSISLVGWMLKFNSSRTVPAIDVDQVSNVAGAGWIVDVGQSGRWKGTSNENAANTALPTHIVSMYRNIDYKKVEKTDHNKDDAAKNREEQLKGVPDGNARGSWKASTRAQTMNGIYESKGRKHYAKGFEVRTPSTVDGKPFIISEIGNDTESENDWVELQNVSDEPASLNNYALTAVTAKGTDTELFDFKDQDWKVPAKGFVVISTRHPRNTDLAVGKDLSIAEDRDDDDDNDQTTAGAKHFFVVKPVNLPDNGEFALILRKAHDKQGKAEALIDVVATRKGAFKDDAIGTSLWPLEAIGLPHDNVIDGGDEVFAKGKVYQRNSGNGRGEKQFAVRGYTGIGYDRTAAATGVNGGTPGYHKDSVKDKIAGLTDGSITISEIMVETGEARQSLAQWIELHNSSMTQAVSLNGWKLHIENAANGDGTLETNTFSATLTLSDIKVSPNQTVLIASSTGRVSDPDHFPSTRVINLWQTKAHREALDMIRRTDPILSTTGFNIKLTDKDDKPVDAAGNLDGDRRTRDKPAWMLPMTEDDGRRSSLLRVYDNGVAIKGTMKDAWVSADATNLAFAISQTYYGDSDDFGTPGFKAGGPLPVSLSKFRPERLKDTGEIVVRWITESELNNAGFNILRSEKRNSEFTKVHYQAGQGTTSERTVYEWKDTSAKPNVVYYYQIQDVSLDGDVTTLRTTHLRGNVTAAGKLTTTWAGLKALQ